MRKYRQKNQYRVFYIDDSNDTSPFVYRSVARRKTDLMPTIPIRDTNFGSRTSLYCSTPRTQGKIQSPIPIIL